MMWVDYVVSMWSPSWSNSAYPNSNTSTLVSLCILCHESALPSHLEQVHHDFCLRLPVVELKLVIRD